MSKTLLSAYYYQFLWQLPNLLIIPILAPFIESSNIVEITKLFFIIAVVCMISDWGHSTVGAQKLANSVNEGNEAKFIFSKGETIRFTLLAIVCVAAYGLIIFANVHGTAKNELPPIILVLLGSVTQLLYPNWAIIGFESYAKINRSLLKIRVTSILILIILIAADFQIYFALKIYYAVLFTMTLVARYKFTRANKLSFSFFSLNTLKDIEVRDLNTGIIYVSGGMITYLTLNSGVFFAEYYFGKSMAASYATAERLLVTVRAVYLPFVQFTIVRTLPKSIISERENTIHISKHRLFASLFLSFVVLIFGEIYFYYLYNDLNAIYCFRILIVGLAFLGISHHYVTFLLLARGYYYFWILGLLISLICYFVSVLLFSNNSLKSILIIPAAVVIAEVVLLIYGFLFSFFLSRSFRK
jgi:O-antigen/teichoic acid export membrane protein